MESQRNWQTSLLVGYLDKIVVKSSGDVTYLLKYHARWSIRWYQATFDTLWPTGHMRYSFPSAAIWQQRSGSRLAQVKKWSLPYDTKPLSEAMLTNHQWGLVAFSCCSRYISLCLKLMRIEGTNLLLLTISAFWSSSRWPLATYMSSRRQRSIPLGGRYRQVSLICLYMSSPYYSIGLIQWPPADVVWALIHIFFAEIEKMWAKVEILYEVHRCPQFSCYILIRDNFRSKAWRLCLCKRGVPLYLAKKHYSMVFTTLIMVLHMWGFKNYSNYMMHCSICDWIGRNLKKIYSFSCPMGLVCILYLISFLHNWHNSLRL